MLFVIFLNYRIFFKIYSSFFVCLIFVFMREEKILLKGREFTCQMKKYGNARSVKLMIGQDNSIKMTLPKYISFKKAKEFLEMNLSWLETKIKEGIAPSTSKKEEYKKFKANAKKIISERVDEINKFYNFPFKKISIRNQSSRWGSCSTSGTLSFNYKIALLPRKYTDYIVAHELCHLKEMNHSKDFWHLVAMKIPDYKNIRRDLKRRATV